MKKTATLKPSRVLAFSSEVHLASVPLVKVLHAIFHGALVGPHFVVAALHQGFAPCVHALGNFVVFDAGFHVGGFLRFYKFSLEGHDFFGVIKLHHVQRFFGADGMQSRDREHMRIPLHHDVGVVSQPNGAVLRDRALAVLHQLFLPTLVDRAAGFAQFVGNADGLNGLLFFEFPVQIVAGDKVAKARVKGLNVVIL